MLHPLGPSSAQTQILSQHRASFVSFRGPDDNPDFKYVQLLVEISKIGEIDTLNERYQAEFYIEAKWIGENDIVEYDPKRHWNPKLYVENTYQEPKETLKYDVSRDKNNNTIVTEVRHIKGLFWERLELQNFPVDVQELSITITSRLSLNDVKLTTDPMRLSYLNVDAENTFIEQQKWRLYKLVKVRSIDLFENPEPIVLEGDGAIFKTMRHSKISFTCYCSRKPEYYFFNAYFLIFLITVSALTIFSVDCKLPQSRLQTTYTLLLTSVSFKWVINRQLPAISYLTSLDKYAITCIFYVCLLCVWHSIVGSFWTTELARFLDFWSLIIFSAFFVLIHLVFLIWLFFAHGQIRDLRVKERDFMKALKEAQQRSDTTIRRLARL